MDLMDRRRFLKRIMAQGASSVETGSFVVSTDTTASSYHISHHLGSTPDFLMVVADEFTASNYPVRYIANGYCAKSNLIATNKSQNGFAAYCTTYPNNTTTWVAQEFINITKFLHDSNFEVPYYNRQDTLKAGVTYRYVVGKFE